MAVGLAALAGCTSSNKSTTKKAKNTASTATHKPSQTAMDAQQLAIYRSKLSDLYGTQKNTVPAAFEISQTPETIGYGDNYGYRIQIISTEHKDSAEAVLHRFNDWIFRQPDIAYKAHAYIIFKPPVYRVHIGDFLTQQGAIRFARILQKKKYPDAWIVRDEVNPNYVPADSLSGRN